MAIYIATISLVYHLITQTIMKHRLALFFIALLSCLSISAQKFELDPLWGDSIECMVASKTDSLWKISEPIQSVKFPKGMEIESCGKANGYYVAFKKDGASYMAYMGDLKFSADNSEGTVNPLSEDTVKKHSALGHFYATYTPAVLVLILMGMILATFFVARKSSPAVPLALKVIPVCMLLISIIEVVGYKVLGGDMFWWCDNDRYGFFGSLFRVIPFGAVVALQFYTFKMFETLIFSDVPAEKKGKLSLKPAMVSLAACLPVLIAYAMIVQLWLGWQGMISDAIMFILFLGTLVSGIAISVKKNAEALGAGKGLIVTIFSVIYLVGLLIAAWGVIIVLLKIILQVLMVIAGILALSALAQRTYYKGSDGHVYAESGFENLHRVD